MEGKLETHLENLGMLRTSRWAGERFKVVHQDTRFENEIMWKNKLSASLKCLCICKSVQCGI